MNHHPTCSHPVTTYRPCPLKGWSLTVCETCGATALERERVKR